MDRPKGLTLTAILMGVCNASLLAAIRPGRPPYTLRMWVGFTVLVCIGYFAIWSYWKGRNWARIGILLFSGASIFNLLMWNRVSLSHSLLTTPTHTMMAARAVLGAALLYYLNTRPVVEFFYSENTPPRLGWGRILYGSWVILSRIQYLNSSPNQLKASQAPPVAREVVTLIMVLIGACVIAWGIRAESRPMLKEIAG